MKRIGKSVHGKPPLLLVVLPSEYIRNEILRNAKRLRKSATASIRSNVYINSDRTRLERDEFKLSHALSHRSQTNQPGSVPHSMIPLPSVASPNSVDDASLCVHHSMVPLPSDAPPNSVDDASLCVQTVLIPNA